MKKKTKKSVWKLTAVTISHRNKKYQGFLQCKMVDGKAILSRQQFNKIQEILGVKTGDTLTMG